MPKVVCRPERKGKKDDKDVKVRAHKRSAPKDIKKKC